MNFPSSSALVLTAVVIACAGCAGARADDLQQFRQDLKASLEQNEITFEAAVWTALAMRARSKDAAARVDRELAQAEEKAAPQLIQPGPDIERPPLDYYVLTPDQVQHVNAMFNQLVKIIEAQNKELRDLREKTKPIGNFG